MILPQHRFICCSILYIYVNHVYILFSRPYFSCKLCLNVTPRWIVVDALVDESTDVNTTTVVVLRWSQQLRQCFANEDERSFGGHVAREQVKVAETSSTQSNRNRVRMFSVLWFRRRPGVDRKILLRELQTSSPMAEGRNRRGMQKRRTSAPEIQIRLDSSVIVTSRCET